MPARYHSLNPADVEDGVPFEIRGRIWVRYRSRYTSIAFWDTQPSEEQVRVLPFWNNDFRTKQIEDLVLEVWVHARFLPPSGNDPRRRMDVTRVTSVADETEYYDNAKRPIY